MAEQQVIRIVVDPSGAVTGSRVAGRAIDGMTRRATVATTAVGRLSAGLRSLGSITFGVGAAVAISKITQTVAGFEQQMANVRAVTQANTEQFAKMTNQARQLGAFTRFSAQEAASGMEFLGRAGFKTEQIIGTMPGMLDLAAASNMDLGRAADITSNIMAGFALNAAEASRVADVLATTSFNSNTTVEMLGEGMKYVAPIASALGRSVEETSAAIGALSNSGIQASLAGTGLRRSLSELASPTKKTRDELKRLGISIDDVNPKTHTLVQIFTEFKKKGLDAAGALEIFGDRGGPAAITLATFADQLEELNKKTDASAGSAKRAADIMNDTLAGALRNLRSAFEEILLSMGDRGFGGYMRSTVESITQFLRQNKELVTGIGLAVTVFGTFTLAMAGLGLVLTGVSAGISGIVGILGALASPLGLVIAGLGTLAYWFYENRNAVVSFGENTFRVKDIVVVTFQEIYNVAKETIGLMIDVFSNFPKTIDAAFGGGTFDQVTSFFKSVSSAVVDSLKGLVNVSFAISETLIDIFITTGKGIYEGITRGFNQVIDEFNRYKDLIQAIYERDLNKTLQAGYALSESEGFVPNFDDVKNDFSSLGDRIANNFKRDYIGDAIKFYLPSVEGLAAQAADRYKKALADAQKGGGVIGSDQSVPVPRSPGGIIDVIGGTSAGADTGFDQYAKAIKDLNVELDSTARAVQALTAEQNGQENAVRDLTVALRAELEIRKAREAVEKEGGQLTLEQEDRIERLVQQIARQALLEEELNTKIDRRNQLEKEALSIRESIMSNQEKYVAFEAQLEELYDNQLLSLEEVQKALKNRRELLHTAGEKKEGGLAEQLSKDFESSIRAGVGRGLRAGSIKEVGSAFFETFQNMLATTITEAFLEGLKKGAAGQAAQGLLKGLFSFLPGGGFLSGLFGFAKGGIAGYSGPIKHYSAGGIETRASLFTVAEHNKPEAIVPLPDGRNIPVEFNADQLVSAMASAGMGGGSGPVIIQLDGRTIATAVNKHSQNAAMSRAGRF